MMSIASCPTLSAGIERQFSSMALVPTKLRNRLGSDRVAKIFHVYRHLCGRKKTRQMTTLGETSEGGKELKNFMKRIAKTL